MPVLIVACLVWADANHRYRWHGQLPEMPSDDLPNQHRAKRMKRFHHVVLQRAGKAIIVPSRTNVCADSHCPLAIRSRCVDKYRRRTANSQRSGVDRKNILHEGKRQHTTAVGYTWPFGSGRISRLKYGENLVVPRRSEGRQGSNKENLPVAGSRDLDGMKRTAHVSRSYILELGASIITSDCLCNVRDEISL